MHGFPQETSITIRSLDAETARPFRKTSRYPERERTTGFLATPSFGSVNSDTIDFNFKGHLPAEEGAQMVKMYPKAKAMDKDS